MDHENVNNIDTIAMHVPQDAVSRDATQKRSINLLLALEYVAGLGLTPWLPRLPLPFVNIEPWHSLSAQTPTPCQSHFTSSQFITSKTNYLGSQYYSMSLPALPRRAAYITLNTPQRRNALSLAELRSLRDQLIKANTSPTTGRTLLLPPFQPSLLSKLEQSHATLTKPPTTSTPTPPEAEEEDDYTWLTSSRTFAAARAGLPSVLVLASHGPVFSSGHDLRELRSLPAPAVAETFRLCAEVMSLVRRSPALVVARLQGAAVAAGCQLALTADLPVAHADVGLRLPGAGLGLPCSSPVTAVGRRLGNGRAFWMLAMAEEVKAREVGDVVRVVEGGEGEEGRVGVLDREVLRTVERLVGMSPQQSAMGKWAFWTQAGLTGRGFVGPDGKEVEGSGGDGYMDAVEWAGRVMALHAKSEDAKEGMDAFLEKRQAVWCGFEKQ
ncbi:ClpP/crotonase-like domain-containing protein [Chaetomium sp. MPI-CAGE-AT-0009]|nr:ClpP/crotonase-like domain-containing protein [Chaetomium sp. MPI-CAGE-AT-0009]